MKQTYWTEIGLAAKEALQSQKIYDSKTKHRRHPRLEDLVFSSTTKSLDLTKEEWKERFTQEKAAKEKKLEDLPYSKKHDKLILSAYSGITNQFKQAAEKAAHEEKIKNMMIRLMMQKNIKLWNRQKNCPYLLIVQQKNSKTRKPYDSMVIPSSNDFNTLYSIGKNMSDTLTVANRNFHGIEIWDRLDYIDRMKGDKTKIWKCYIPKNFSKEHEAA